MSAGAILDLVILATLLIYVINGFLTGFIIQCGRLIALVAAIWAMRTWTGMVEGWLQFITSPGLRAVAAALLIFLVVLLFVGSVARLLKKIVTFSLGGFLDKILGGCLAFCIGVIIWALILLLLEKMFPAASFLQESRAVPWFSALTAQIAPMFPPALSQYLEPPAGFETP